MIGYQKKKSMAKILSWPYIYFKKKLKIQLFIIKKQKKKRYSKFFYKADLEYPSNSNLDTWL